MRETGVNTDGETPRRVWSAHLETPAADRASIDLADPVAVAAARARLLGWALLLSSVLALLGRQSQPPSQVASAGALPLVALVVTAVLGVALLRARHRLGDNGFIASLVASQVLLVVISSVLQRVGGHLPTDLILTWPTVAAAAFCGRRVDVAGQVAVAVAAAGFLDYQRTLQLAATLSDLGAEFLTYAVVAFAVRWLRERAVQSLLAARLGEVTDPLTGLANRRGLERLGAAIWQRHAETGRPLGVLLVDIDHFKRVNDTLGHAAGDDLLSQVAHSLGSGVREADLVCRLGGEEFAILAEIDAADAVSLAERLRTRIASQLQTVTVSIGVVQILPGERDDIIPAIWHAVNRADEALYVAKNTGRNRVVDALAGPPSASGYLGRSTPRSGALMSPVAGVPGTSP